VGVLQIFSCYLLIIVCFDDVIPTSQFESIVELKQAIIVSAWQQLSQAFIVKSLNEWRRRLECVVQQNGGHVEYPFK